MDFRLCQRSAQLLGVKIDRGWHCGIEHRDVVGGEGELDRYDKLWYGCLGESVWELFLNDGGIMADPHLDVHSYERYDLWANASIEVKTRLFHRAPEPWWDMIVLDTKAVEDADYFCFSWICGSSVSLAGWLDAKEFWERSTLRAPGQKCGGYRYPCEAYTVPLKALYEPDDIIVALRENSPVWGAQAPQGAVV